MASAIVHMSCHSLRNEGILGMGEEERGVKRRPEEAASEDFDRNQVKKRRKQSKPNRIASTELGDGAVGPTWGDSNQPTDPTPPNHQTDSPASQEAGFSESSKENKKDEPLTYSDTEESLEGHSGIYNMKFPLNLSQKTPSPQESIDSFSSTVDEQWYKNHENPSLLYNLRQNPDTMNLKTPYQSSLFQPTQACNMMLPGFKRILVGNNENQIASPHRIFNPEAFCDLCNKEFCNKYFLKTHKANKHGIYMENIGPNPMENLPAIPLMNYFSSSLANPLPLPTPPPPAKKPSSSSSSTGNRSSSSSMRAFCNICQREFCNKYFVRRHKAKIHGIIENNVESEGKPGQGTLSEKVEVEAGPSSGKKKEVQEKEPPIIPPLEEEKPIKKEVVEKEEDPVVLGPPTDSPQDALSLLVASWQTEESKDRTKSPDRSKKLSSSNTAFCEICCKEYCNKYFLRVHKQKCHGIPFPDKEKELHNNPSNNAKQNQPMPLNLILRENNKNVETETSINCNVCNYQFSDKQSLKIHQEQAHKPDPDKKSPLNNSYPLPDNQGNKNNLEYNNLKLGNFTNHNFSQAENYIYQKKNSTLDIQKMNTMLLRLNQHMPFENYTCEVCDLDFGTMPSLENHIIRDHSSLIEEISNSFYEENHLNDKFECSKCQKQFPTTQMMEVHFTEKHGTPEPKTNIKIGNENDLNPQMSLTTERHAIHTPTSSFCEICKKELCNKYFMKTHMQRMHGISIENGAQIGGVVCDICNKELCSKYFLRVHKQNSHGIVEEAFLPQIGSDIKVSLSNSDNALRPNENDLSHRYFSHFTEVCSICSRRFRSAKWLKAHLLNDHGEEGKVKWKEVQTQNGNNKPTETLKKPEHETYKNYLQDLPTNEVGPSTSDPSSELLPTFLSRAAQKQYQCTQCPFTSTVLALLIVHERTHLSDFREVQCPLCSMICENTESLDKHLALKHNPLKTTPDLSENAHVFHYDDPQNKEAKMDNNFEEITEKKVPEACYKCLQCPFVTQNPETYGEHLRCEHKSDGPPLDYLQVIRDALLQIANNSNIPASFAVPNSLGNFMMQPFVLEDKAYGAGSFLSSLVFLPVKERLNKPITASFKLTPT